MSVRVTIKDEGAVALFKRLRELKGHTITIGFQGSEGGRRHPLATVNVATVAMFNEFGTSRSPARPFMRTTIFEHRDEIVKLAAREYGLVIEGKKDPVEASSELGKFVAKLLQDRIDKAQSWAVPNALSTVEKKGHSMPLLGGDPKRGVARGTMRNSITWVVRRNGSVIAKGGASASV